jgi:hypothetical protein
MRRARHFATVFVILPLLILGFAQVVRGDDEDLSTGYWLNINPHHAVTDKLSGFGNFGYYYSPDNYSKYEFGWPGVIYTVRPWLQLSGGLNTYFTDNDDSANTLELRPFADIKVFAPRLSVFRPYNRFRYEYRTMEDLDTQDWDSYSRIRNRTGAAFPLAARERAWQPKSFYGFADVEFFYRFDRDDWDPLRVRGGLGYILTDRVRCELIYTAGFTRSAAGDSLEHTGNSLQLNLRMALHRDLLSRLFNPGE